MEEKNEEFRAKHVPMPLCSPPHRLALLISLHEAVSVMCHTLLELTDISAGTSTKYLKYLKYVPYGTMEKCVCIIT